MPTQDPISHAAFLVDAAGKIFTWNAACQRLLGYAENEVLNRSVASILDEAARQSCLACLKGASGDAARIDAVVTLSDGRSEPFNLAFVPQFCESGKFAGYSVIISAPLDAGMDSELEMIGRTPLNEMVDFLAGTFYVINPSGRLVMWNRRVEEATQRSFDELLHMSILDFFSEEDKTKVAEKVRVVFEQNAVAIVEAAMISKDGTATPYLFSGARFQRGKQIYLCGMGLDISERLKQEEQLRLRDRALHASSNGIVIARCGGNDNLIEYVNLAFERITGYRAHEVIGRDPRFMAAPGLDENERTNLRTAINTRREATVVFRNMKKNGEVFWNNLTVTPVLNDKLEVTHFIGVIDDVTAAIQRTSHLEHAINHDILTGLASRNLLWDRLEQALHVAQRNKTLVATVLVDLDNFKDINDTLGHDGGDEALKVVARRLQASVRDSDTVARLGGDEFVLVLDNQPSLRFTLRMIDRLRLDMTKVAMVAGREIGISASIGVSIFPHDGKTVLELVQAADVAMYHAKAAGRNNVKFYSKAMKQSTEARQMFETSIQHAIDNDEMFLLFQPRVQMKTGAIVGAEALLRWMHPERGVLLPCMFLQEAEDSGLIVRLGEWVLDHVCATLAHMRLIGFQHLVLSMNVSFREFSQKDFPARVAEKLALSNVAKEVFEVEINEAHLMRDPQHSSAIVDDMRQRGIGLAIDQFGDGIGSLSRLQKLAVNHIKIAKTFIDSIDSIDSIDAQAINGIMAKTTIAIGHSMNIGVIAECVETDRQWDFLMKNNCDEIQGNYFSEPVSLSALEQLLTAPPSSPHLFP